MRPLNCRNRTRAALERLLERFRHVGPTCHSHTLFFLFPLHHPPVFLGPLSLSLSSSSLPMGPSAGGLRPFLARRSATSATNLQHHTQRARRGASSSRRSPVAGPERDGGRRRRDRWGGRRKRERGEPGKTGGQWREKKCVRE
jgi:hypothetical protein